MNIVTIDKCDQIAMRKSLLAYLQFCYLDSSQLADPFWSYVSRHVLDGHRTGNEIGPGRQKQDRDRFMACAQTSLIRPTQGDTTAKYFPGARIPFRSAFERLIKSLISNDSGISLDDLHRVTRFASPFCVIGGYTIFVAMETVPFALKNKDGDIINPRTKSKIRGINPYLIDPRTVLTIRWPRDIPFLRDIFGPSPYPDDQDVAGTLRWEEFLEHPFFKSIIKELTMEVQRENPGEHPAIKTTDLFDLGFEGNVEPMSPVCGSNDIGLPCQSTPNN